MNRFIAPSLAISFLLVIGGALAPPAHAIRLGEYLFWNSMGNAAGDAAKHYANYKAQRDLWRNKIAEGEAKLKACGSCAQREAIEKDLRYWKQTENRFQEIAGQAFAAVGMPPVVGKALGIDIPMTPGPSAEERRRMHTVARPAWADDRPEFCRQAVDKHISCLRAFKARQETVFTGNAEMAGGLCYDQMKLFRHCAAENYEAFHAEVALQKRRAAGEIIPEYLEYRREVYYGDVPDDFMPTIPKEVVLEELAANEKPHEVRFSMRKKGTGMLSVAVVRPFHHTTVAPTNSCAFTNERSPEIERRICYDYYTLSWHVKPLVLFCQYSKADGTVPLYPEAYKFWYLPPPKEADPTLLLSRADNHPALTVAEQLTDCPLTEQEAKRLHSQWWAKVERVRAVTPQISAREHLPKPQWLVEANRKNAELYEILQRHKAATKEHPFGGVYMFETTLDGETTHGQCTMHPVGMVDKHAYILHCRYSGGEMVTEVGYPHNGWFQVRWNLDGRQGHFHYFADTADPNLLAGGEDPHALVGDNASISGRLVRTGDLTPLQAFPVEGVYRYERAEGDVTDSGRCEISTYKRHQPPSFLFHCNSLNGEAHSNSARNRDNALYVGWPFPGTSMHLVSFIVGDNPVDLQKEPQTLLAWSERGGYARLTRIGDLDPEPVGISQAERSRRERAADEAWRREVEAGRDPMLTQRPPDPDVESGGVAPSPTAKGGLTEPESPAVRAQQRRAAIEERRREIMAQRELARAQLLQPADPIGGSAQQASAVQSTPQTESAAERCTAAQISGIYRTSYGLMKCESVGDGLDCCYGGRRCERKVTLAFDDSGQNLTGNWSYPNGMNGPAIFPVSSRCELETGKWSRAGVEPRSLWRVTGRQP